MLTADGHLSESTQHRYIAYMLGGVERDHPNPSWAPATEHLATCLQCRESAVRIARELGEAPQWRLLEPGEFERSAQQLWVNRLLNHPQAPIREAAAHELASLEPLGHAAFEALMTAAENDSNQLVRAAAENVLHKAHRRNPIAARLHGWIPEEAFSTH